jgi:hypothetical protein
MEVGMLDAQREVASMASATRLVTRPLTLEELSQPERHALLADTRGSVKQKRAG